MNSKDYRNLQEAYLDVYEQEEALDEGKSSRPRYPGGRGVLDQETRDEKRESSAENMRGHTEGPGNVTKNPKKLRKQKSMGELGEQKNIYDIILSHLIDEGYADTEQAAEAIMVNMSEEWRETIVVEGYKEIDREKHGRMYDRYKKLGTAAMKDARETGEASGDNRFKMSKMMGVIDKSAENLRNKR
jgi:hypothetical protein